MVAALTLTSCSRATPSVPITLPGPPSTTTTLKVELAPAQAWLPVPGEVLPEVKKLAADVIQAIGTYKEGGGTLAGAGQRLPATAAPALAQEALPLLVPTAQAAVDIIYPQLSGLTKTDAGIMMVFRQRLLEKADERAITRVADMRFKLVAGGWTASQIILAVPPPPVRAMSAVARSVLDNGRIRLPEPARWDIQAGIVDDRVLRLLLLIAQERTVDVTVFAGGHPRNVFGTARISNHIAGRAVDVWAVGDVPVISQRDRAGYLYGLTRSLLAQGVTELGAPWDFDGPAKATSFANTVHMDHLHLGFDR